MRAKAIPPTEELNPRRPGGDGVRYTHPAYGVVTLTNPRGGGRGGGQTLFGSDIGHNSVMRITISRATLDRDLCHDFICGGDHLLEFEMSHAQFAEFITSQGNGSGTPITLTVVRDGEYKVIPPIVHVETKYDMHRKEIHESVRSRLEKIEEEIQRFGDLLDSGKIGKRELTAIFATLKRHADQLPGSLDFSIRSAEEALEKATSHAKIEVESFIGHAAKRIGLNRISELAQIEDQSK